MLTVVFEALGNRAVTVKKIGRKQVTTQAQAAGFYSFSHGSVSLPTHFTVTSLDLESARRRKGEIRVEKKIKYTGKKGLKGDKGGGGSITD